MLNLDIKNFWIVLELTEKTINFQERVILVKNENNPTGILFSIGYERKNNQYIMAVKKTNSSKVFSSESRDIILTLVLTHITAFFNMNNVIITRVDNEFKNYI